LPTAQNDSSTPLYNEFNFGVNFNTLAGFLGGFDFRYAHAVSNSSYRSYSLNLTQIRHPKEIRGHNEINGRSFIPGKSNYLFMIRPQYGWEKVAFVKREEQGVQMHLTTSVGPTFGLVVPYVIAYDADPSPSRKQIVIGQYDPDKVHSFTDIVERQTSSKGFFSGSSIVYGASVKSSIILEMSSYKKNVAGFEIGIMADGMIKPIEIMPLAGKKQYFLSTFLTIFYGWRN